MLRRSFPPALLAALVLAGCGSGAVSRTVPEAARSGTTQPPQAVRVPRVERLSASGAELRLKRLGLPVVFDPARSPKGCKVADQRPDPGDVVEPRSPVTLDITCPPSDWSQHKGKAWGTFTSAYASAYDDGCDALFAGTSTGALKDEGGMSYDASACDGGAGAPTGATGTTGAGVADAPREAPKDPAAAGTRRGFIAGCTATFTRASTTTLTGQDGDSYAVEDCKSADALSSAADGAALETTGPSGPTGTTEGTDLAGYDATEWGQLDRPTRIRAVQDDLDAGADCPDTTDTAEELVGDIEVALADAEPDASIRDLLTAAC